LVGPDILSKRGEIGRNHPAAVGNAARGGVSPVRVDIDLVIYAAIVCIDDTAVKVKVNYGEVRHEYQSRGFLEYSRPPNSSKDGVWEWRG
jgi:hypothetical protein